MGQKTNQGIYKKQGAVIEVYDPESDTWHASQAKVDDELKTILKIADHKERMHQLFASNNKQAQFLAACFRDLFHYCAYHLQEIADTVRDVDLAIRWGFGWQQGPFETWQLAGVHSMMDCIEQAIRAKKSQSSAPLPQWLATTDAFYTEAGAYSPASLTYQTKSQLPVYQRQFFPDTVLKETIHPMQVVYENEGIRLTHLQEDVLVLSLKTKANTIGQSVLDGFQTALDHAEKHAQGLIIHQQDAHNFSSGADLRSVLGLIHENRVETLGKMMAEFQNLVMRIKYSKIPILAALRGRALGGGCELMMHCASVVAAFESYPGLVEIGVGLLPAGGGCKEMALRAARQTPAGDDPMALIQNYFQQIATAKVAGSAPEAMQMGYLRATDGFLMHTDEVLYASLARIKALQAANYLPAIKTPFPVAGIEGHAKIQAGLVNWLEGGFISEYDYYLANEIAKIICGGTVNQGTLVPEEWILKLERETFVMLASNPLTQARIRHVLETGKPLRN